VSAANCSNYSESSSCDAEGGRKDDAGKRRWTLLPIDALGLVVDVLGFGAAKYGADNWKRVPRARERYLDAALRHLAARLDGELTDEESNLPHLAHAVTCLLFVLTLDDCEGRHA